jgi:replicative DNA helicase
VQRLRRWVNDGKVTFEQVAAVAEMFDDVEDRGLPNEDDVSAELTPVIQRRMRDEAVKAAIDSYGKGDDLHRAVEIESRASRLGDVDTSIGTIMGAGSFAEIRQLQELERLKTGVVELDAEIGGLQRSGLGVLVGASGDGKSMGLSHFTGVGLFMGLHVAVASLELPRSVWLARVKANVTNIPIDALLSGAIKDAELKLAALAPRLGRCVVQEFTPHVTTVEDIRDWMTLVEDQAGGWPIDLLVVDYGDKLTARAKRGEKESGEYAMGRIVFEGLRILAVERKLFCWTASQANRQKDRKKRLDLNDVADSMHKIRVADLVITLNLQGDGDEMSLYVAKHRTGKSRFTVGPLPCDFAMGRIAPVVHDDWVKP